MGQFDDFDGNESLYYDLINTQSQDAANAVKLYRPVIRKIKCPIHKQIALIDHSFEYKPYKTGNYACVYYKRCCCDTLAFEVEKALKAQFVEYERYPILE